MSYTCGSSIYVSLFISGPYTTVHIRQHLNTVDDTSGNTQVNRDGLFLTTDEFASLLFQLKAIEKSFKKEGRVGEGEERVACIKETVLPNDNTLSSIISNVSLDVVDSGKRKASGPLNPYDQLQGRLEKLATQLKHGMQIK